MLTNWNILFWEYDFLAPQWLWLLFIVPILLIVLFRNEKRKQGELKFSRNETIQEEINSSWVENFRKVLIVSYGFIAALLIIALARPFQWNSQENFEDNYKKGIDIIIAMDVSVSMLARDFEPNRMEASKKVAKEFINGRVGDRIGLVVYAGEAYTACPATLDYEILKEQLEKVNGENIEGGTAIGTGLGTAVSRLRNDSIPSKVIILLTDGSNNAGEIMPETAAELAKAKNVRVYTIGVGMNGEALSPVITPFGIRYEYAPVEIDEVTLTNIANTTGGKYFRATDEKGLKEIYKEIEKLEKSKLLNKQYKSEPPATPAAFMNWAFVLLLMTWFTNFFLFRTND
ncbi:MAG: VWA domain-containing protein [Flavobacteriia bacterium]|nr:VWA domain-containing protein [Flavobacteriia bacterium]